MQYLATATFLGIALVGGGFTSAAEESVDLDDVERVGTHSLDDVQRAGTEPLEAVGHATTQPLEGVDTGETVDGTDPGEATHSLDSERHAATLSLGAAEAGDAWSAPPCHEVALQLPRALPGEDAEGWSNRLEAAQRGLGSAKERLRLADAAYSRAITHRERGEPRASAVATRDTARRSYSRARCELPALVEDARRAGVQPAVIRPYQ